MDFKLKDVCTVANIGMALYAVVLSFQGELEWAGWLIFAAWFTDGLDGLVARWTRSGNEFGVHFDNQADLFIYSVAPACLFYATYRDHSPVLGMVVCFAVITVGCIRLSRFNVKALIYPGFWIGYPRSASGLSILFLVRSDFFAQYQPYVAAAALALVMTALNLSYIPYRNHKTPFTAFERWVCRLVWASIFTGIAFGFLWDGGLFYSMVYFLLPFTPLHAKYREPIRRYIADWKAGRA